MTDQVLMQDYNANWEKVIGIDLYHHKTKELAICATVEGQWIVLSDKRNPSVVAEYDTFDDAFAEWSHA